MGKVLQAQRLSLSPVRSSSRRPYVGGSPFVDGGPPCFFGRAPSISLDAKPLAHGSVAETRRGVVGVCALVDAYAQHALACALPYLRHGTHLPGPLQIVPDRNGRALLHGASLCGSNALRAHLARRAENWRWSSLWQRQHPGGKVGAVLHAWPLPEPADWVELVNAPQTKAELEALRLAVNRGSPFGSDAWQRRTAKRLGLEYTLRARGRPKKETGDSTSGSLF
jgi:hypothetical protein